MQEGRLRVFTLQIGAAKSICFSRFGTMHALSGLVCLAGIIGFKLQEIQLHD